MERSPSAQEAPIAKAAYTYLQENMFSSFDFPAWNKGRIVCQRSQLKQLLSSIESSSDASKKDKIITLSNSFPLSGTRTSTSDFKSGRYDNANSDPAIGTTAELMTSTV